MGKNCKRCGMTLGEAATRCGACGNPVTAAARKARVRESGGVTAGQRIAGLILVLNGAVVLVEAQVLPVLGGSSRSSGAIDVILGVLLLGGVASVVPWVKVRTVLGALVFTCIYVATGDHMMAVIQLVFSGLLSLLLFGAPGFVRVGVAVAAAVVLFVFQAAGLQQHFTGRSALARYVMPYMMSSTPLASDVVAGDRFGYTLTLDPNGWQRRDSEAARAENPLADVWLVNPEFDAHLMVIAEEVPGARITPEQLAEAVMSNSKAASPDFAVLSTTPLAWEHGGASLLEAKGTASGIPLRFYFGLYTYPDHAVQVIGFAAPASIPHVEATLRAAVQSFQPVAKR